MDSIALFGLVLLVCVQKLSAQNNCLGLGAYFYEDIGCPSKSNGTGCASFEDCRYKRPKGGCLYRGHELVNQQPIPRDSACTFGCFCSAPNNNRGRLVCAQGTCGSWAIPAPDGCHYKYSLDQCCSTDTICGSSVTCAVDEKVYKEGEIFRPKGTCLACLCASGFNGTYDESQCRKRPCTLEIRHSSDLEKNCAPVYYRNRDDPTLCCPDTIQCPSNEDVVIDDKPVENGKTCRYGTHKFKEGKIIQRTISQYGKDRNVTCRCVSPPWLTCTADY